MKGSPFLKTMHPKSEIRPAAGAIERILRMGWVGQKKVHGHRVQIHVSADPKEPLKLFNRHGKFHKAELPPAAIKEVRRLLTPAKDWNVVEAEWLKGDDKLFLFDFIREEGRVLRDLPYLARWEKLPRTYVSPHVRTLPVLKTAAKCLEVLGEADVDSEGLVFKSGARGFSDTSIVRCRKPAAKPLR